MAPVADSAAGQGVPVSPAPPAPARTRTAGPGRRRSVIGTRPWVAALFLLPALVLLGALVAYPIGYTIKRSLYDADDSAFVGLKNYGTVFTDHGILTAVRNNAIWVVVAPTVATALGLVFAVLTERVQLGHGVQAGRLHADGDLDAGRGHHLPAGVRPGPVARGGERGGGRRPRHLRQQRRLSGRPAAAQQRSGAHRGRLVHVTKSTASVGRSGGPAAGRHRRRTSCRRARGTPSPPRRSRGGHRHRMAGLPAGRHRQARA